MEAQVSPRRPICDFLFCSEYQLDLRGWSRCRVSATNYKPLEQTIYENKVDNYMPNLTLRISQNSDTRWQVATHRHYYQRKFQRKCSIKRLILSKSSKGDMWITTSASTMGINCYRTESNGTYYQGADGFFVES